MNQKNLQGMASDMDAPKDAVFFQPPHILSILSSGLFMNR